MEDEEKVEREIEEEEEVKEEGEEAEVGVMIGGRKERRKRGGGTRC